MFRTTWFHPQEDSYICSMVCLHALTWAEWWVVTHSPTHSNALSYPLEHTLLPTRTLSPTHSNALSYPLEHTLLPTRTRSPTHSNTLFYPLERALLPTRTLAPTHSNALSYPLERALLPTRTLSPTHSNTHLENCVFHWFVLCNCIIMHSAKTKSVWYYL